MEINKFWGVHVVDLVGRSRMHRVLSQNHRKSIFINQNLGKVDFSKIPKDFLSFEGPFSHRNPSQSLILVGPTLQMGRA